MIDVTICIPTRQARQLLCACLQSLASQPADLACEVIVVDNNSRDGTVEMIRQEFPAVKLICNDHNAGFTRPANQALRLARGRYALLLNSDTEVPAGAIARLVKFADTHPEAGICGPRVVFPDGTLQKQCRRNFGTPWSAFCYQIGLGRLFPGSRLFDSYLASTAIENRTHPVAAVSGSCMLIRKELMDAIGLLDETYFAYWEDSDYCYRAYEAGWKVFYVHESEIVHHSGKGGSHVEPFRTAYHWHRSHFIFYRKYLSRHHFFLVNLIYYLMILLRLAFKLFLTALKKLWPR